MSGSSQAASSSSSLRTSTPSAPASRLSWVNHSCPWRRTSDAPKADSEIRIAVGDCMPAAARAVVATTATPTSVSMLRVQDLPQKIAGRFMLRVAEELLRCCLLDDLAVGHENHAVGHAAGKTHFVCDAQHGHAVVSQADHGVQHFLH